MKDSSIGNFFTADVLCILARLNVIRIQEQHLLIQLVFIIGDSAYYEDQVRKINHTISISKQ